MTEEIKPRIVVEQGEYRVVKRGGTWHNVFDIERRGTDKMGQPNWRHAECISDYGDKPSTHLLWEMLKLL